MMIPCYVPFKYQNNDNYLSAIVLRCLKDYFSGSRMISQFGGKSFLLEHSHFFWKHPLGIFTEDGCMIRKCPAEHDRELQPKLNFFYLRQKHIIWNIQTIHFTFLWLMPSLRRQLFWNIHTKGVSKLKNHLQEFCTLLGIWDLEKTCY